MPQRVYEPIHSGIHLDVYAHAPQRLRLQKFDLPVGMNDRLHIEPLQEFDVGGVEKALKKQNALRPARPARPLGVAKIDRCKSVGRLEGLYGIFQSMAVGVCLHNRPNAASAGVTADAFQIAAQRSDVDFSTNGTRHEKTPKQATIFEEALFEGQGSEC